MTLKQLIATGVHTYTALGLIFAFVAWLALRDHNVQLFCIALWVAVLIDATDGTLARRFDVKNVLPNFDGRRLDDIIDYLTYVFLPVIALIAFDVLPEGWHWVGIFPLMASGYGFCQERAKTSDAFVGFPSYWNIIFLYLYVLPLSLGWVVGILVGLSILVFIPIQYIYPTQTPRLKTLTLTLTSGYGFLLLILCFFPEASWADEVAWVSLLYAGYYIILSLLHHWHRA